VLIIRFVSADEFNHFIQEIFILFVIHVTVVLFIFIPGGIPFLYGFNGPFTHPDAFLCFTVIRLFYWYIPLTECIYFFTKNEPGISNIEVQLASR